MKSKTQIILLNFLLIIFVITVVVFIYLLVNDENLIKKEENIKPQEPTVNDVVKIDQKYFENLLDGTVKVNHLEEGFDSIEELSNQQKLSLLFYANNDYLKELEQITKETVDTYFEKNYCTTIIHENIKCDINSEIDEYCYLYDEENMIYIGNFDVLNQQDILSQYTDRMVYSKTTDYIENGYIFQLTRYELYKEVCSDNCNLVNQYFSTVKDANKKINPLLKLSSRYSTPEIIEYNINKMYSTIFNVNFDIYKNLMPSYTYTFEKMGDNYILTNYQINTLD